MPGPSSPDAPRALPFTITPTPPTVVKLKPGEKATLSFTVTSLEAPDRKRAVLLQALRLDAAGKGAEVDWLVAGPSRTLSLAGGETATVTITARPTAAVAAGEHKIELAIADSADPSETYAYSAPVTCEIDRTGVTAPPEVKRTKFPLWLVAVIAGVVVLGVGIAVAVKLLGKGDRGAALGEACAASAARPCREGSICAPEGTCLRPEGATCAQASECASGDCAAGRKVCAVALGSPCTSAKDAVPCRQQTTCSPATNTCLGDAGARCTTDAQCSTGKCAGNVCIKPDVKAGDPCETTCPAPLQCSASKHCGEPLGRPCEQDLQCVSDACDTGQCVDAAVRPIGDAIAKITAASSSWQTVLPELLTRLPAATPATVRGDLQTLLDNARAAAQSGGSCTISVVGLRALIALEVIRNKLLGRPPPTTAPLVCASSPAAVEFAAWQQNRVPQVRLTGFDLGARLRVQLVQSTGTAVVGFTSPAAGFQATIDLGPTGVRLTPQSQRLVVLAESASTELAVINIVQPQPRICQESDLTVRLGSISFTPPNHTRGDNDFGGHGPRSSAHLQLIVSGSRLNYQVNMTAEETQSDFTTVTGSGSGELSLSPPVPIDRRITAINGPSVSDASYVDSDFLDDHVRPSNGGPVAEFVFTGDTNGPDVGRTRLVANFNAVGLHLVETRDCVTRAEARALLDDTQVTPDLARRLRGIR